MYRYRVTPAYEISRPLTLPRIVAGLSLGEAQRPSTVAILGVTGSIQEPVFQCASIHRFKTDTPIRTIALALAEELNPMRLCEALPIFRHPVFQGKTPSLAIDATLIGEHVFSEFQRLKASRILRINDFVALQITNGDRLIGPEYRQDAEWFRIPKSDLASVMRVAFEARRFRVLSSVGWRTGAKFEKEIRNFRGRTTFGEASLIDARERPNDDMLLAAASAAWLGSRPPDPPVACSFGYYEFGR